VGPLPHVAGIKRHGLSVSGGYGMGEQGREKVFPSLLARKVSSLKIK